MMFLRDLVELYQVICCDFVNINSSVLIKNAFDTRRIDQNLDFNPRRNLQYYQRSEPFIDKKMAKQLTLFTKIKTATDQLKEQFIGEPIWLDSNTRLLSNAVNQTLRTEQNDFDYSAAQLDYLSELLYVRYRLKNEDLETYAMEDLKEIILSKDEPLVRKAIFVNYKKDINKKSDRDTQDNLLTTLFGNVKANKENKEVERSITIKINDKVVDDAIVKEATNNLQNKIK